MGRFSQIDDNPGDFLLISDCVWLGFPYDLEFQSAQNGYQTGLSREGPYSRTHPSKFPQKKF